MKKQLFLFAVLLFIMENCIGQISFQKTYYNGNGSSVQQTYDGGYAAACGSSGKCYLIKTNENGDSLWTKFFGGPMSEGAASIQQTTDTGYIIVGITASFGSGLTDVYLLKTDSSGNLEWSKTYGTPGAEQGQSVQQTYDGGYIITGRFAGNSLLIKVNVSGDTLWTKSYGGCSVHQTSDSGFIIIGEITGAGAGGSDVYVIKTDTAGVILWAKTYGGTFDDYGYDTRQTSDGGYIIVGSTNSFGAGYSDVYLIKTDTMGSVLWSKSYGGGLNDEGNCVQQTHDGGYIIIGSKETINMDEIYVLKNDSTGNTQWSQTFGSNDHDHGYSVAQTDDGGYILAGTINYFGYNDICLVKIDSGASGACGGANAGTGWILDSTLSSNITFTDTPTGLIITTPATLTGSGITITSSCGPTGIGEIPTARSFLISPNPSSGIFIITLTEKIKHGSVSVFNTFGEKVFDEKMENALTKEIHLGKISSGIYFIRLTDAENKNELRAKVVVE